MSNILSNERFDRQIRLWGVHGQQDICASELVIVGSDCLASEILKNLTLHGIVNVTIVDDAILTKEDIGRNFFVGEQFLGKPRAEAVAHYLMELNPDIKVTTILKGSDDLSFIDDVKANEDLFVITTGFKKTKYLKKLSDICREKKIRNAHIQIAGFIGGFYLDGGLHHYYEGTSGDEDPALVFELRILNPFPELQKFFDSFDFENLSSEDHAHIPYPVILNRAAKKYMEEKHIDKLSYDDECGLIDMINRISKETPGRIEIAFEEARNKVKFILREENIPNSIRECKEISDKVGEVHEPFWEMFRATERFCKKHGVAPHYGGCPDMNTTSDFYNQLKEIYKNKSKEDWNEVRKDLEEHGVNIDDKLFDRFRRCILSINGYQYSPVSEMIDRFSLSFYSEETFCLRTVQLLLIIAREFYDETNKLPMKGDKDKLLQMMCEKGADKSKVEKFVEEFCRYEGGYIPSVAGSLAAVLSEEITKIIIHQVCPTTGIVIYDGIHTYFNTVNDI